MTCPGCGTDNTDTGLACASCGLALGLPIGTVLAERYLLESLLGMGGLGRVYRAHDRMLEEDVAVKVLHPEAARSPEMSHRFRSEIKLARRVRHRNVCAIHEYGEHEGHRYVSMELVDGVDLHRVLHERGPLPTPEAMTVAIEVTRGLAAIHAAGVIHRDLKTPNIMLDRQGGVRLLDFGIAKSMAPTGSLVTAVQKVVGTPEYMSPEQIRGDDLDERSDLYALGVVIYELVTGEVPFRGKTPLDTLVKQVSTPPPLYGEAGARLPESLLPVLRRCLAKRRDERYDSAREVVEALREAQLSALLEGGHGPGQEATPLLTRPAPPTPAIAEEVSVPPATGPAAAPLLATPESVASPTPPPRTGPPIGPPRNPLPGAPPLPTGGGTGSARPRVPVSGLGLALALFGLLAVLGAQAWRSLPFGSPHAPGPGPTRGAERARGAPPVTSSRDQAPPAIDPATASPLPTTSSDAEDPARTTRTPRARTRRPEAPTPTPTATPSTGRIAIEVAPAADLQVDGRDLGPWSNHTLDLAPGTHFLRLSHPDYWPITRHVKVTAGTATRVQVDVTAEGVARARAREAPYTSALDGSPSDPYFDRGLRQMAAGDFQEALLTLDPVARRLERSGRSRERARVELYLAVALLELGRAEDARARFERALDLDGSVRLPVSGFSANAFALFAEVRAAVK